MASGGPAEFYRKLGIAPTAPHPRIVLGQQRRPKQIFVKTRANSRSNVRSHGPRKLRRTIRKRRRRKLCRRRGNRRGPDGPIAVLARRQRRKFDQAFDPANTPTTCLDWVVAATNLRTRYRLIFGNRRPAGWCVSATLRAGCKWATSVESAVFAAFLGLMKRRRQAVVGRHRSCTLP
jgi:hypothetical protein